MGDQAPYPSIHAFDDGFFHGSEGADVGDAVPGVLTARAAAHGFITLQEAGHEEFFGEGGEFHAAPGVVIDDLGGVFGIDDAEDGAGLRGVVGDGELVFWGDGDAGGESHEGVPIGGVEADLAFQHFFNHEADVLRGHGGAADEGATDACGVEIDLFSEGFEQLRGGEEAGDFAVFEDEAGLIDDVVHVLAGDVELFVRNEFFDEAWVEVDEVAGAATEVGEVLDGEAEAAGAGGADHEPGTAGREVFVTDFAAEFFVVGFVVVPADALFGHAGGAAGFEDVVGLAFEGGGHPDIWLEVAEGFILEVVELGDEVGEGVDDATGVKVLFGEVEPEGASGFWAEVPLDGVADLLVELGLGFFWGHDVCGKKGVGGEEVKRKLRDVPFYVCEGKFECKVWCGRRKKGSFKGEADKFLT